MKTVKVGSVGLGRLGYEHAKTWERRFRAANWQPSAT